MARTVLAMLSLAMVACATLPRAPAGTCLQRTMDTLQLAGLPDSRRHCVASAAIAQQCGRSTAWFAGWAKELSDLLGPGDFEGRDLAGDRAGRDCAAATLQDDKSRTMDRLSPNQSKAGQPALGRCCEAAGY